MAATFYSVSLEEQAAAAAPRPSLLLCEEDSLAFPGEYTLKKIALMNEPIQRVTLGPRNHSTSGVWVARYMRCCSRNCDLEAWVLIAFKFKLLRYPSYLTGGPHE